MSAPESSTLSLHRELLSWWKRHRAHASFFRTAADLAGILREFALGSLPEQRRRRFGDAEYDWDFRVNTTSATVHWRDRFLGLLHSPYMPTEPVVFHQMLDQLAHMANISFEPFTFIDIGSGKGRTLLMASDYPFHRIIGVELLPALHHVAQENIAKYQNDAQKCGAIESICSDVIDFKFPSGPLILYFFNPLPEDILLQALNSLRVHIEQQCNHANSGFSGAALSSSECYALYHNAILEHVFANQPWLEKLYGSPEFVIYKYRTENLKR